MYFLVIYTPAIHQAKTYTTSIPLPRLLVGLLTFERFPGLMMHVRTYVSYARERYRDTPCPCPLRVYSLICSFLESLTRELFSFSGSGVWSYCLSGLGRLLASKPTDSPTCAPLSVLARSHFICFAEFWISKSSMIASDLLNFFFISTLRVGNEGDG